jgi:hypothetical protein
VPLVLQKAEVVAVATTETAGFTVCTPVV